MRRDGRRLRVEGASAGHQRPRGAGPCVPARHVAAVHRAGEGRHIALLNTDATPGPMRPPSRSGVRRPLRRAPLPPEMLDDLVRLSVAYLDEFVVEVPALPFDDHRREFPTEVIP